MTSALREREKTSGLEARLAGADEKLLTCVHCGLCLPACPTYRQLGNENDSPRGRIYLMRARAEGRIGAGFAFTHHIDLCLGCRACETVCPSGVPYGHLLEAARAEVMAAEVERGSWTARVVRGALNRVFTHPRRVAIAMRLARWFRDTGLARLALETELVGGRLRLALALLAASRSPLAMRHPETGSESPSHAASATPEASGARALRVALLRGCVMEGLFAHVNRATERVLERQGCRLVDAPRQACCGALHAHAGEIDSARALARRNIDAFLGTGCEAVVVNSAGCGAAMKEYGEWLAGDPDYMERARQFSARVRDVSEFLAEIGIQTPPGRVARRVAYDAPCHLLHAQRISEAPVSLLRRIPGLELVPLEGSDRCCGGAGIYNLQHVEMSEALAGEKVAAVRRSGAELVATGNPGCIMQIGAGLLLANLPVDAVHPIELLDAAYADARR